jgi:hypothetical protein
VDAGQWRFLAPVDGIADSLREDFRIRLEHLKSGEHVVVIRVFDSADNAGLAKAIIH